MNRKLNVLESVLLFIGAISISLAAVIIMLQINSEMFMLVLFLIGTVGFAMFCVIRLISSLNTTFFLKKYGLYAIARIDNIEFRSKLKVYGLSFANANNIKCQAAAYNLLTFRRLEIGDTINIVYNKDNTKEIIAVPGDYIKLVIYTLFSVLFCILTFRCILTVLS